MAVFWASLISRNQASSCHHTLWTPSHLLPLRNPTFLPIPSSCTSCCHLPFWPGRSGTRMVLDTMHHAPCRQNSLLMTLVTLAQVLGSFKLHTAILIGFWTPSSGHLERRTCLLGSFSQISMRFLFSSFPLFLLKPLQFAWNWKIIISPGLTSKTLIGRLNTLGSYELLPVRNIVKLRRTKKTGHKDYSLPLPWQALVFQFSLPFLCSPRRGGHEIRMFLFGKGTALACTNKISHPPFPLATWVVLPVFWLPSFCLWTGSLPATCRTLIN